MGNKNYLIEIKGNEVLLDRYIEAINNKTCLVAEEYPNPCLLDTGEKFLTSKIIKYFFDSRPFSKEHSILFFENLRKLIPKGFSSFSYDIGLWIEEQIDKKFFNRVSTSKRELKPEIVVTETDKEILSFMCYLAICHTKYGPSYATVTANEYFEMVTALGSKEVSQLKKVGTGNLPKEIIEYKDSSLTFKANDAFGTIKIKLIQNTEEAYSKVLNLVCTLLKSDFPKSYSITFSTKEKEILPIKGLIKCSQNHLFAGAVKYINLHSQILEYIKLAQNEDEWYNNLDDENNAMPSTFAVFALGLESEKYFDTVINYLQAVDEGHQYIQAKFTVAFVQKYGINKETIDLYIHCLKSMEEHPYNKLFAEQFTSKTNLELLVNSKRNILNYFSSAELEEIQEEEKQGLLDYTWESMMYSTFGPEKKQATMVKKAPEELKELYAVILNK